jgi:enediyne biosynthesis thioesterase
MSLVELLPHRMSLRFDYQRLGASGEELVARGTQDLACMRRRGEKLEPEAWPQSLREALLPYQEAGRI